MGILGNIAAKVKEIRERNIARREAINRVKRAVQSNGKDTDAVIDAEAKELSETYHLPYADCLLYVQSERKASSRKAAIRQMMNSAHEIGENAKQQSAKNMKFNESGLTFKKPDVTKSKLFPES